MVGAAPDPSATPPAAEAAAPETAPAVRARRTLPRKPNTALIVTAGLLGGLVGLAAAYFLSGWLRGHFPALRT